MIIVETIEGEIAAAWQIGGEDGTLYVLDSTDSAADTFEARFAALAAGRPATRLTIETA